MTLLLLGEIFAAWAAVAGLVGIVIAAGAAHYRGPDRPLLSMLDGSPMVGVLVDKHSRALSGTGGSPSACHAGSPEPKRTVAGPAERTPIVSLEMERARRRAERRAHHDLYDTGRSGTVESFPVHPPVA